MMIRRGKETHVSSHVEVETVTWVCVVCKVGDLLLFGETGMQITQDIFQTAVPSRYFCMPISSPTVDSRLLSISAVIGRTRKFYSLRESNCFY
jgi:hypothetical protein